MTCSHTFPLAPTAESQMSSYWTLLLNNALTLDGLCAHCSTLCPLSLLPNPWNTHSKSTLETRAFPHLQYKVLASFSPLYLSLSLSPTLPSFCNIFHKHVPPPPSPPPPALSALPQLCHHGLSSRDNQFALPHRTPNYHPLYSL